MLDSGLARVDNALRRPQPERTANNTCLRQIGWTGPAMAMSRRDKRTALLLGLLFVVACLIVSVLQPSKTGAGRSSAAPSSVLVFMATNVMVTPATSSMRLSLDEPAQGEPLNSDLSPGRRGEPQGPRLVPARATSTPLRSAEPAAWRPYHLDLIDTSYRHSAEMRPGYQPVVP